MKEEADCKNYLLSRRNTKAYFSHPFVTGYPTKILTGALEQEKITFRQSAQESAFLSFKMSLELIMSRSWQDNHGKTCELLLIV